MVVALGSLTAAGCGSSNDCDDDNNCTTTAGALRVQNQSDFAITEIHVTSVGSTTWGPNLISGNVLAPGASLTVAVTCDHYDALLIDEAGEQCTLHNVDLCSNNADWIIQNNTCAAFTNKGSNAGAAPASGAAH